MKQNRKRILSIMAALMLSVIMIALPVAAEEAETIPDETAAVETVVETAPEEMADAQTDTEIYPEQDESNTAPMPLPGQGNLGRTWQEVVETERIHFGENADISQNCSIENKTTEGGMAYTEGVITGVPQGEDMITADQYYYLTDNKVVALVHKYILSDSSLDIELALDSIKRSYGPGAPLDASTLNSTLLEMVRDQIDVQTGMLSWVRDGVTAVVQTDKDASVMYLVLIPQAGADSQSAAVKLHGLTGTEDLTPDEIRMVNTFIDFLQAKMIPQVNEYIEFLKGQR